MCLTCHMIDGKGGRLGPDLTTTRSARSTSYLVDSVRDPSRRLAQGISEVMKEFSQEYETVKVETVDGLEIYRRDFERGQLHITNAGHAGAASSF